MFSYAKHASFSICKFYHIPLFQVSLLLPVSVRRDYRYILSVSSPVFGVSYFFPGCLVRAVFLGGETMLTKLDWSPLVCYNFHKPLVFCLATSNDIYRSVTLLLKKLISQPDQCPD